MAYLGDIRLEDTIDFKFTTVGTTGAPTTLSGSPVISAFVGNSETQITAGITLTVDFDTPDIVGLHNVRVVATTVNGYTAGTNVDLVITTGTVGGTSVVGYVVGSFSIENRVVASVSGAVGSVTAGVTVTTNNDKTGYSIGAGGIGATAFAAGAIDASAIAADAIGASELAQGAAQEIADEVLNRDLAGGASGGTRNVRNALRSLRNKAAIAAGTLTVYQEDDTTSAWTATVATTAGDPISEVNPAGP